MNPIKELEPNVLAVSGTLQPDSSTSLILHSLGVAWETAGCKMDMLDLQREPLELFSPVTSHQGRNFQALKGRVELADVLVFATPDYHGCMSGVLKNFLDHFWQEFAGKLFATVVVSHDKGLTVMDQLRTVARQCYAWALPYGLVLAQGTDVKDGQIVSDALRNRMEMFARDVCVYGRLLADQRREDLMGSDPCFMARLRRK